MSEPTTATPKGYLDDAALVLDGYGTAVDYILEQVPEIQHPQSVRVFARMRREPQLASILRVYLLALERGVWTVDGEGCRDEVTAQIADDLGLPIKGADAKPTGARRRGFTFAEHLRLAASLSLSFGHAPFAQQWNVEGGRFRLGMVQERMPQTIAATRLNADGTLKSVEQGGNFAPGNTNQIRAANNELVWYAREREGSNYYGVSLLRAAYGPWLIKDQMLRVLATSHRRFGMGIPQVTAPQGATPQQEAMATRMAAQYRAGEFSGAGLPYGFSFDLKGMTGSAPDTLGFIQYLDRLATRSTLTSILDMATAERGSRSLGETVMQLMIYAQQAEGDRLAEDATRQLVIPLVDANYSVDEACPRITVTDIGRDTQATAQDLALLLTASGLTPDDVLENDLRRRYGLTPIDQATRRFEVTAPGDVEPDPNDPNEPKEAQ